MVHALEKVITLLESGGSIIEIHDLIDPPKIGVSVGAGYRYLGQILSDTDFEYQRLADEAILQSIHDGIFTSTQSCIFEYLMRADSLESMIAWLEESWESAFLTESSLQAIKDAQDQSGEDFEIIVNFVSRILKLDPVWG